MWKDGYVARTVGDKGTAEVIRRSIQQHHLEKTGDAHLSLFAEVLSLKAPPQAAGILDWHLGFWTLSPSLYPRKRVAR